MAGIGFELKKLFNRRGLFATFRAYGYAGVVCTGPMLLGVVLLLGVMFLCDITGGSRHSRELLVCMITYTLLASLTVTSFLSMVVTRFIADQLYEENYEAVLPSFWGSSGLMLIVGGILYGVFLIFSGAGLLDGFLCFGFFGELIITWNAMSYLTAIKDYRGILLAFIAAILVTFLTGWILLMTGIPHVEALLIAVSVGYGVMMVWDVTLLYQYFPSGNVSAFFFLRWVDQFLPLAFTGLFINIGLFAHLVIMWMGPLQVKVQGLFVGAPYHDVPALIAFLTILVTTVNFVVSVEVNFYPKYRNYYSLFNDKGAIGDIKQAGKEMKNLKYGTKIYGTETAADYGAGDFGGRYPSGVSAAWFQRSDGRIFPDTLCGIWPLCGSKYNAASPVIFYGLQRRIVVFRDFCGRNFCIYDNIPVFPTGILWIWFSGWMCGVFSVLSSETGLLYKKASVLHPECTAGGSGGKNRYIHRTWIFS